MATEVRLPQFGMGMQDGVIIGWLRNEGDTVEQGEIIVEVEAAKAVMEVSAPASGTLACILAHKDQTVPVRDVIAIITAPGETLPAGLSELASSHAVGGNVVSQPERAVPGTALERTASPRVQIEPRARKLAKELGIDPDRIQGSGPAGRVTEDDVRRARDP